MQWKEETGEPKTMSFYVRCQWEITHLVAVHFSLHTFGGQVLESTEESLDTTINSEARDMISPAPTLVQTAA